MPWIFQERTASLFQENFIIEYRNRRKLMTSPDYSKDKFHHHLI
jgi:hypothetical protein